MPQQQTRWTLAALKRAVPCYWEYSLSGIWQGTSCAGGGA
jgi:hypothetical protein